MKKMFKFAFLSAIAFVGAVSFSACSSSDDMDESTTSLVSTMKAFGIEADNVLEGVMSKVNKVGYRVA